MHTDKVAIQRAVVGYPLTEVISADPALAVHADRFDRDSMQKTVMNRLGIAPEAFLDHIEKMYANDRFSGAVHNFNKAVKAYHRMIQHGFSPEDIAALCGTQHVEPMRLVATAPSNDEFEVFRQCRYRGLDVADAIGVIERIRAEGITATAVDGTVYRIDQPFDTKVEVLALNYNRPDNIWKHRWMKELRK